MFYYALAGVREGATGSTGSMGSTGRQDVALRPRRPRRRQGLWFWRWFSPLLAVSVVAWVGFFHHMNVLSSLHPKQPDALLQQQSSSGVCEVRLARVLPPLGGAWDERVRLSPESMFTRERRKLYENMETSLDSKGLLVGGTQGLSLGDLFTVQGRSLQAVLHELEVPVRAVVIPMRDAKVAGWLHEAVMRHLAPIMPDAGMWVQNHGLYHSTVFHTSTHTAPVTATAEEVRQEAERVAGVARRSCPLRVVLERVVATPSGTVLACWQLAGGTDPTTLRRALRAALPAAPEKQMVTDEAILHTTLARVVAHPLTEEQQEGEEQQQQGEEGSAAAAALQRAVHGMTQELCGVEATLDTLWFVEEQDRLALALEGRFTKRPIALQCEGGQEEEQPAPRIVQAQPKAQAKKL